VAKTNVPYELDVEELDGWQCTLALERQAGVQK
jgi:hypothetical protein